MAVLRIVPNLHASDPAALAAFHSRVFGVDLLMDGGFIFILGGTATARVQISLASEGGSGTELPSVSIDVDDLEAAPSRAREAGAEIPCGPVEEPWGSAGSISATPSATLQMS